MPWRGVINFENARSCTFPTLHHKGVMQLDPLRPSAGTPERQKQFSRGSLQELNRFAVDHRGGVRSDGRGKRAASNRHGGAHVAIQSSSAPKTTCSPGGTGSPRAGSRGRGRLMGISGAVYGLRIAPLCPSTGRRSLALFLEGKRVKRWRCDSPEWAAGQEIAKFLPINGPLRRSRCPLEGRCRKGAAH